jgi:hypothetical protein
VTGKWQGAAGGDSSYLELTQANGAVTGNACEGPGKDCYTINSGKMADRVFTGNYGWTENGKQETVGMSLTLSADGKSLTGPYVISKCSCTRTVTLTKL